MIRALILRVPFQVALPLLSVPFVAPVYGASGEMLEVFDVDLSLHDLGRFMTMLLPAINAHRPDPGAGNRWAVGGEGSGGRKIGLIDSLHWCAIARACRPRRSGIVVRRRSRHFAIAQRKAKTSPL